MSRRKLAKEHENHERWLVSYADFITLLFAFFVVMYAISSINEGKYRVLSDALVAAFRNPREAVEPIQLGDLTRQSKAKSSLEFIERPHMPLPMASSLSEDSDQQDSVEDAESADEARKRRDMASIAEAIKQSLQPLVDQGLVDIRSTDQWLEVEIKDSILFPSGSARLQAEAAPVLKKIAVILRDFPNAVRVEGFTDNLPINTLLYPSNWELSGARAASVVRLLSGEGIDPRRLSALGYGEFRPLADNATPEGRAQNRRVVVVVLADEETRRAVGQPGSGAEADPAQGPAEPSGSHAADGEGDGGPTPDAGPAPVNAAPTFDLEAVP
jgi:chemotaxis protein MotB